VHETRRHPSFFCVPNSEVLPRDVSDYSHGLISENTYRAIYSTRHFHPRLMQWDHNAASGPQSHRIIYIVPLAEKTKSCLATGGYRFKRGQRECFSLAHVGQEILKESMGHITGLFTMMMMMMMYSYCYCFWWSDYSSQTGDQTQSSSSGCIASWTSAPRVLGALPWAFVVLLQPTVLVSTHPLGCVSCILWDELH